MSRAPSPASSRSGPEKLPQPVAERRAYRRLRIEIAGEPRAGGVGQAVGESSGAGVAGADDRRQPVASVFGEFAPQRHSFVANALVDVARRLAQHGDENHRAEDEHRKGEQGEIGGGEPKTAGANEPKLGHAANILRRAACG